MARQTLDLAPLAKFVNLFLGWKTLNESVFWASKF